MADSAAFSRGSFHPRLRPLDPWLGASDPAANGEPDWAAIAEAIAVVLEPIAVEICQWQPATQSFTAMARGGETRSPSSDCLTLAADLAQLVTTGAAVLDPPLTLGMDAAAPPRYIGLWLYQGAQPYGVLSLFPVATAVWSNATLGLIEAIAQGLSRYLTQQWAQAIAERERSLHRQVQQLERVEAVLRESEARYALAAQGSHDGLWEWHVLTDECYLSPSWKYLLGYGDEDLPNRKATWLERFHPEDRAVWQRDLQSHCDRETAELYSEYRLQHRDGNYRWMLSRGLAVRDATGQALRLAGFQSDITDRKLAEEKLRHNALHDQLTGLANRVLFRDRLAHVLELSKRYPEQGYSVIFLDLDRFKIINDSLGHWAGDQLLIKVARHLQDCLRKSDTCARLGGDEFVILLEHIDHEAAVIQIVQRLQHILKQPFYLDNKEIFIDASIGIVMGCATYTHPDELLRDADTAMYHAKAAGKGRYEVFTPAMHESALAILNLETDLRRAIDQRDFQLYYQPIVAMRGQRLVGFEALLRWPHPTQGLIAPAKFIPIAEETGLILPLGGWVLRQACTSIKAWQLRYVVDPPLSISVNMSRRQFFQPDLVAKLQAILAEVGLDPHHLHLEIAESAIMEDVEAASRQMQELRALGIRLCMDDFGTGYSSLSHLHLLPIDGLKLDPSFLSQADTDLEKLEIIRTITTLAWNLGIEVVAEGVETPRQLTQLALLKCELAQGYLFSQPLSSQDVPAFLDQALHPARLSSH